MASTTSAGIAALALALVFSPVATAARSQAGPIHAAPAHPRASYPNEVCYTQLDNDNGNYVVSQQFQSADATFDNRGADDFTLQSPCSVQSVDVAGTYFNGSGPALRVQVRFFSSGGTIPGSVLATRTVPEAHVKDDQGSFHIPLADPVALTAGTFWVSVRVRMDFGVGGQWGWLTNNTQRGAASVWKNPGGGFGLGCPSWTAATSCIHTGEGPDEAFTLKDTP